MAPTGFTYDDKAMREDLLAMITNLDFKETQLMSGLGTSKATSIRHEWLQDTLKTPAANAAIEGADASYAARTNPTRLINYTQILTIPYEVTDTDRDINAAGFGDRMSYEMEKALKEWKQDAEFSLMRSTLGCGTGSAARTMKGLKSCLTLTTTYSAVSLSEVMLNDYLQNVWDKGVEVNAIYGSMTLKRRISSFTAGATKNVSIDDRRLVNAVDIYQADAAKSVKLFPHRFVTVAGTDTNNNLVGVNEDYFKVAYLRSPKNIPLAKVGDSSRAMVVGEMTLEFKHPDAGFNAVNLL
jgi:hypothetical protein